MTFIFKNFSDFIQMGGYSLYVWPAYILVFVVLVINVLFPWRRHLDLLKKIKNRHDED